VRLLHTPTMKLLLPLLACVLLAGTASGAIEKPCNYCRYCDFCGHCSQCPCAKSAAQPACDMCKYVGVERSVDGREGVCVCVWA